MDISKITDDVYVGRQPEEYDYEILHELDIGLIICMRAKHEPLADPVQPPIPVLWLKTYDDVLQPIPLQIFIQGVTEALLCAAQKRKIFVYCAGGRHRSVAMAAAILIARGANAKEAGERLKARRAEADPDAWHIRRRIERFETYWRAQHDRSSVPTI